MCIRDSVTSIKLGGSTPSVTLPFVVQDVNNTGLMFAPCLTSGSYNGGLVQTNDSAIFYQKNGASNPSSGLVIAPWGSGGIRITTSGLTVNGTIVSNNTINGTTLQENGIPLSSKYIDSSSTQTISGSKTFTNQTAIVWAGTTPTLTVPFYVSDVNNTGLMFIPCLPSGGFNSLIPSLK